MTREDWEQAQLNPKTHENALILLQNISEEHCRSNCEELGSCDDCWIDFEQIQAIDFLKEENEKLLKENKELTKLVANKVIADYDYESILKEELDDERIEYICLESSKRDIENILTEFEKWLWEKINIKPANKLFASECLDKLQELKGDKDE